MVTFPPSFFDFLIFPFFCSVFSIFLASLFLICQQKFQQKSIPTPQEVCYEVFLEPL